MNLKDPTYLVVYMFWTKLILVELGPYITIAILNTALVTFIKDWVTKVTNLAGSNGKKILPSSP